MNKRQAINRQHLRFLEKIRILHEEQKSSDAAFQNACATNSATIRRLEADVLRVENSKRDLYDKITELEKALMASKTSLRYWMRKARAADAAHGAVLDLYTAHEDKNE
jgi:hypothetical protein